MTIYTAFVEVQYLGSFFKGYFFLDSIVRHVSILHIWDVVEFHVSSRSGSPNIHIHLFYYNSL